MNRPRVLLTGSKGFIGQALKARIESKCVLASFDRAHGQDMLDSSQVREAIRGQNVVLHFAATAVGRPAMAKQPEAKTLDLQGLRHVAEAVADEGALLIYPSSTVVSHDHAYGTLKRESELLLHSWPKLRWGIVRLPTVYGPGMPADSVVAVFLDRALRGEPLTIFGPGTERRSFLHLDDVGAAFEHLLKEPAEIESRTVTLDSGPPVTLRELAELIVELTGSSSAIVHTDDPAPADSLSQGDALPSTFAWRPQVSLREGLLKMLVP